MTLPTRRTAEVSELPLATGTSWLGQPLFFHFAGEVLNPQLTCDGRLIVLFLQTFLQDYGPVMGRNRAHQRDIDKQDWKGVQKQRFNLSG